MTMVRAKLTAKGAKAGARVRRYAPPADTTAGSAENRPMRTEGKARQAKVNTAATASARRRQSPVVYRMPAMSRFPQNWAVNTEPPEQMPKRINMYRKKTWLPRPTAAISTVPRRPTITVSSMLTEALTKLCNEMGIATAQRFR